MSLRTKSASATLNPLTEEKTGWINGKKAKKNNYERSLQRHHSRGPKIGATFRVDFKYGHNGLTTVGVNGRKFNESKGEGEKDNKYACMHAHTYGI